MTSAPHAVPLLALLACLVGCLMAGGCSTRGSRPLTQSGLHYTVQDGDTLTVISARYNVAIADIVKVNRLKSPTLEPGQELVLPGVSMYAVERPPVATESPIAEPEDVSWFVPRSAWSVEPIDTSNIDPMTTIYRVTVHHSGDEDDASDAPMDALRLFEKIHKHTKGWACIGYHFIIDKNGRVYEGRPLQYQGAHAVGVNNVGNIGICLIGDFDHEQVPSEQRLSLIVTLDRLCDRYGIEKAQVFGHREFKATDCPGRYLMPIVEQYRGSGDGELGPPVPRRSTPSTATARSSASKSDSTRSAVSAKKKKAARR